MFFSNRRRAFTLVELLVAMALTLILVYAIAHFYAIIGDAVKDGRSMIELNQQLRGCVERLKSDLDSVTIPVVPWADEGGAAGYFEIREGAASDWDINGNYRLDADYDIPNNMDIWPPPLTPQPTTPTAGPGDGRPDFSEPNVTNLQGDTDDVIAMTIRAGSTPFSGQALAIDPLTGLLTVGTPLKITNSPRSFGATSPYAEVVWWTSFNDINLNGRWDLSEPRLVHRRQLLVRPDLNTLPPNDNQAPFPYYVRIPDTLNSASPTVVSMFDLYQYCDISMRPQFAANGFIYFVANSLADLCKRENRFMHYNPVNGAFPFALDLNPNLAGNLQPSINPDDLNGLSNTLPRHDANNAYSQYRWVLFDGGRKGEDVILTSALAFDVRVFDPDAIVRSDSTATPPPTTAIAVQPGDAGYAYAVANGYGANAHAPYVNIGTGAYVDLGYGVGLANSLPFLSDGTSVVTASNNTNFNLLFANVFPGLNQIANSPMLGTSTVRFAGLPSVPLSYTNPVGYRNALGFTYDTWTLGYERDGIDQNSNGLFDEGTNGLDDDNANGVDDTRERETVPPYPTPLRGVQVRVRVYEPNTRQTRQATVVGDFIPE